MPSGVCITGMGLVCPLGPNMTASWDALVHGRFGVGPLTRFDASPLPTRIAGEVRDFRAEDWMDGREARRSDRFIHLAIAAAEMAIQDSKLDLSRTNLDRVGVIIGTGMGGLETIENTHRVLHERGYRRVSPFFIPGVIANLAPGQISIRYGFRGPNFAPVSACATGNHALGSHLHHFAMTHSVLPPTINVDDQDPACPIDCPKRRPGTSLRCGNLQWVWFRRHQWELTLPQARKF